MKDMIKKYIQISTAVFLFIIAVYGIVYAQQVCCSKISDRYINDDCCKKSSPCNSNNQQQLAKYSENLLADIGTGDTCCETDRCDGFNQAAVFSISFVQDIYPFQSILDSFNADSGVQSTFHPKKRSISHNVVPIYILTESIIC